MRSSLGRIVPSKRYVSTGRGNTDKTSLVIVMLTEALEFFDAHGGDLRKYPITFDSWYGSRKLVDALSPEFFLWIHCDFIDTISLDFSIPDVHLTFNEQRVIVRCFFHIATGGLCSQMWFSVQFL